MPRTDVDTDILNEIGCPIRDSLEWSISHDRWQLLQFLARDMKCSNPDEYLRDCGECLRCCMEYRDGATRFVEATGGYIPGQRLDGRFERFLNVEND